jgi:UDP-glucose 4-epimerase
MPSSSRNYRRALVTGGAGFIGSHLAQKLLERGLETVIVDNLSVGKRENIPHGAEFIEGDICEPRTFEKALRKVDIVFHQAARVPIRDSFRGLTDDVKCNVMGTVNLLSHLPGSSVRKLVFASSMAVYGDAKELPIREQEHSLEPTSPYGVSKLASEKYILCFCKHLKIQAVMLRYFNTYGTRQTLTPYVGVISIFIDKLKAKEPLTIFGDGEQVRDFVHVEDIAHANLLAMGYEGPHAVFNVGTGIGTSVNELARLLTRMMNAKENFVYLPKQEGEPASSIADIGLCRKELEFAPQHTLETGLPEVISWYCRNS